jgi:hypothetical protein
MEAFDESVAEAAGAGFVAGGDTAVCATAALDRTAVRNAVFRLKLVRDINLFSRTECASARRSAEATNNSRPRKFLLICVKALESNSPTANLSADANAMLFSRACFGRQALAQK